MSKRLAEVARKVGVSEATVSRVLNDKPGVSRCHAPGRAHGARRARLRASDASCAASAPVWSVWSCRSSQPDLPRLGEIVGGGLTQNGYTPLLCTQNVGGITESDYVDLLLAAAGLGRDLPRRSTTARRTRRTSTTSGCAQVEPADRARQRARSPTSTSRRCRRMTRPRPSRPEPPASARPPPDRPRCWDRSTTSPRSASSPPPAAAASGSALPLDDDHGRARPLLARVRPGGGRPPLRRRRHRHRLRERPARPRRRARRPPCRPARARTTSRRRLRRLRADELHRAAAHDGAPADRVDGPHGHRAAAVADRRHDASAGDELLFEPELVVRGLRPGPSPSSRKLAPQTYASSTFMSVEFLRQSVEESYIDVLSAPTVAVPNRDLAADSVEDLHESDEATSSPELSPTTRSAVDSDVLTRDQAARAAPLSALDDRPAVVALRRHLPGLRPQLRRRQRRRHGRPRRRARAPRLPQGPRRRRHLVQPLVPEPAGRRRLRRQRLPRHPPRSSARSPRPSCSSQEALALGIRTIIDVVPNHISRPARVVPGGARRRPGQPRARALLVPPRQGRGRRRDPDALGLELPGRRPGPARRTPTARPGEWYLHLFTPEQPDLNWNHPDVRREHEDILRFWFDRGVAGVRIDSAALLIKDPDLPEVGEKPGPGEHPTEDRDELHDVYRGVARDRRLLPGHARARRRDLGARHRPLHRLPAARRDAHGVQLRLPRAAVGRGILPRLDRA